jgi:hypothetical protein
VDDVLTLSRLPMLERRPEVLPAVFVGALLAVLFSLAFVILRTPHTVGLTVDNPLPWRAEVSARPAASGSWTGVGAVSRDDRLRALEYPDQGAEWVFRFSYAGQSEEVEMTRDQLAAADWTVEVPPALGDRLELAGIPETPGAAPVAG